jgi:hypothetical protein
MVYLDRFIVLKLSEVGFFLLRVVSEEMQCGEYISCS